MKRLIAETDALDDNQIYYGLSKSWEEFRDSGLLLYINQVLQPFGWAITLQGDYDKDGNFIVEKAFPAYTKFRGFSEKSVADAYKKISKYLAENAVKLDKEADWN